MQGYGYLGLDKMEHNPNQFQTPEPRTLPPEIDWPNVNTPEHSLVAIQPCTKYIDQRLAAVINNYPPLSPTVIRVLDKRNKAQNIIVLNEII
jgi:hypothetical protein